MVLREKYSFSPLKEFVNRIIVFDDVNKLKSRIYIGNNGDITDDPHLEFDKAYLRGKAIRSKAASQVVRTADLFSGCGGLSLGAKEACLAAGIEFVSTLAIDKREEILDVYTNNFRVTKCYAVDICEILDGQLGEKPTKTEAKWLKNIQEVDILLAGPPCQGHSDLNIYTRRKDNRNRLYERVARFAELILPNFILIENVPPVVHSVERVVDTTRKHLEKLGYKVDSGFVKLIDLGVPQLRKRHVLVASRQGTILIKNVIDLYRVKNRRSIKWAMNDLEDEDSDSNFSTPTKHSLKNKERIKYLFDNNLFDLPNELRPNCHQNDHSYKSMYGRLSYDLPAQTITTGYGSPGQGRYIHPTRQRTITPHEAARLQFIPDTVNFPKKASKKLLAEMIGNAVPMKLGYVFVLEYLIKEYF